MFIQGAGDDDEHWSQGLTPSLFWDHHSELLPKVDSGDLEAAVAGLLLQSGGGSSSSSSSSSSSTTTRVLHVKGTSLWVADVKDLPSWLEQQRENFCCVFYAGSSSSGRATTTTTTTTSASTMPRFHWEEVLIEGKKRPNTGGYWQNTILPKLIRFHKHHKGCSSSGSSSSIILACDNGTDVAVVMALALLTACYDGWGGISGSDKASIRRRLALVQQSHPYASPSRRLMIELNKFFSIGG